MMLSKLLTKKRRYAVVGEKPEKEVLVPQDLYVQCPKCKKSLYRQDLHEALGICPACQYHYPLSPRGRLSILVDKGSFKEMDGDMTSGNPLNFPDYATKLLVSQEKTEQKEAVLTGEAQIKGKKCIIGIMDSRFMMGSMGSVVGEKLTHAIERATKEGLPLIIFSASGGARMQEGIYSLMQMAKTSAAIKLHDMEKLLFISILTNPTTGGVLASYASLGDIIIAEKDSLIGFAGQRVIKQTINQDLPEGFQTEQFQLQHGFVDMVVSRHEIKDILSRLIKLHSEDK